MTLINLNNMDLRRIQIVLFTDQIKFDLNDKKLKKKIERYFLQRK